MKTYNDLYLTARRALRTAGVAAHDLEARLIVAYASGKTREELLSSSRLFVTDSSIIKIVDDIIERRLNGEPIAYIVGEWEFFGLPIVVNESVLIPRVDTELLTELAIKLLREKAFQTRVLDLCTGTGCIGLAIAANVPGSRIVLADNSERALSVCRANIRGNRLTRNATALEVDAMEQPPALLGMFDMIVCNPPYISDEDLKTLDDSVRLYEPMEALDGGADGLNFYRAITKNWQSLLKDGGVLMFECGINQAKNVKKIMKDAGFSDISTHKDTQDIERVVIGYLK